MSYYADLITDLLPADRRDPATAAVVEEVMRENRTALDHLTHADFKREVAEILAELAETDPAVVALICDGYGQPVPVWLSV